MRRVLAGAGAAAASAGAVVVARNAWLDREPCLPAAPSTPADSAQVYDVCVVGAGVVGSAVARELARRRFSVVVVEREDAVAAAASSGNSGLGTSRREGLSLRGFF